MKKRLVWNFEVHCDNSLALAVKNTYVKEALRWEFRYFWPETEMICLYGLGEPLLALSQYEVKHRQDQYYFLPDQPLNLKERRGEIVYKPLLEANKWACAYGKKIKLTEGGGLLDSSSGLTHQSLLRQITTKSRVFSIEKEVLIYPISKAMLKTHISKPDREHEENEWEAIVKSKLELTRLSVLNQIYFSLCIEARSKQMVLDLSKKILGQRQASCDYIHFIQSIR